VQEVLSFVTNNSQTAGRPANKVSLKKDRLVSVLSVAKLVESLFSLLRSQKQRMALMRMTIKEGDCQRKQTLNPRQFGSFGWKCCHVSTAIYERQGGNQLKFSGGKSL